MWITMTDALPVMGTRRQELAQQWDQRFGQGQWRMVWHAGKELLTQQQMLDDIFAASYIQLLENNQPLTDALCQQASEVYDDNISNIASGTEWTCQETDRNHFQDIAVRIALKKLGRSFQGQQLLCVRSNGGHPLSKQFSPGFVPCISPKLILPGKGWWQPDSVEAFYQNNRRLQRWVLVR